MTLVTDSERGPQSAQPATATGTAPLIRTEGLAKRYVVQTGLFRRANLDAVQGVSIDIQRGETLALVGESGSGKSTLGRMLIGLVRQSEGKIWFDGEEIHGLHGRRLREYRKRVGIIFQNPYRSLNPRMTIGAAIAEPLRVWHVVPRAEIGDEVARLLEAVGLPADFATRHPHAMSGGQRQRVAIARALSTRPEFLVADEAVSSLDVSTAAEILNLLLGLRTELSLTELFVTHDLGIAKLVADRVAVMYKGEIVETATPDQLFDNPQHAYTQRLLGSRLYLPDEGAVVEETGDQ
jgi:ABC-type glutathione transport system ATPase component